MTHSRVRIVVFGAGGFVGGWICEELAQRNDVVLVPCVRKWASAVRLARRGIELHQADLEETAQLPATVAEADVVINASMPAPSREPELVPALFLACANAGVKRFIQFSSAAVYGNRTGEVDESMPATPIDDYSRGKAGMEEALLRASATSGMPVFILRPSIIYGPFADAWTVRYVERVVKGKWRNLGRMGEGGCNLIHGQDVARLAIAAATVPMAPGQHVLNLNGPDTVTWNQYIERLGDALGTPDRVVPGTVAFRTRVAVSEIMRTGAAIPVVKSFYRRSVGSTKAAMKSAQDVTKLYPSAGELALLTRKVHYAAERARRILGDVPLTPLDEGLRQSVAWCRVHGVV